MEWTKARRQRRFREVVESICDTKRPRQPNMKVLWKNEDYSAIADLILDKPKVGVICR